MDIKFRIKEEKNEFIAYFVNKELTDPSIQDCGDDIFSLEMEVIQEINSLSEVFTFNKRKIFEAGNSNFEDLGPYIEFREFENPNLQYVINSGLLYFSGDESRVIDLQVLSNNGQMLESKKLTIIPGYNDISILKYTPGYYFIRIIDHSSTHLIKIII